MAQRERRQPRVAPMGACTHRQHLGPPARPPWVHGPCGDTEVPWAAQPCGWASVGAQNP